MATSNRRFTLRNVVVGALVASSVGTILGLRIYERYAFVQTVRSRLAAQNPHPNLSAVTPRLLGDRFRDLRLDLGAGVTLEAEHVQILHELGSSPSARVEGATFTLRGSPDALWETWTKVASLMELPIAFVNPTVEYQDRAVGSVTLTNARLERWGEEELLRAARGSLNGSLWNDVVLSISHPKTVVKISVGDGIAEFAYTPRPGQPAEWMVNLPSQPLGPLLVRLGTGPAPSSEKSRIAGTMSVIVFDDAAKTTRGNAQFVLDHWFVPAWPEASVLTGRSGSIGIRMDSNGEGTSWKLTRVEVGAALFSLVGTGTLTVAESSRLVFEAKGTRNCAQLAANFPKSSYRDAVNRYLKQPQQSNRTTRQATSAAAETVELGLNVDLTIGGGGRRSFTWHLSRGCGLDELQGEGTLYAFTGGGAFDGL